MRVCPLIVIAIAVLLTASAAYATGYRVGFASQQEGPSHASVGASVRVSSSVPGAPGGSEGRSGSSESLGSGEPSSSSAPEAESACVREPRRIPCAPPPEAPEKPATAQPAVTPAVVAMTVASRLNLPAGAIESSPSKHTAGLTGAASWFWLSPTPSQQSLSTSAGRESVTVTASIGAVRWNFGEGETVVGGPGVAYRPGPTPQDAVLHVYQTRCLPGDQGHDPNVASSCGPNGYEVQAVIEWRVSFQASGPITTSGPLPSRTTAATLTYPVTEARAFLTNAGGT
jgi:hypothetical protein